MLRRNATHGALFLQVSFWIRHSSYMRIALSASIFIDRKIPINLPLAFIHLATSIAHVVKFVAEPGIAPGLEDYEPSVQLYTTPRFCCQQRLLYLILTMMYSSAYTKVRSMKSKKTSSFFSIPLIIVVLFTLLCIFFLLYRKTAASVLGTSDSAVLVVKELYIPLGTGVNNTTDWVDVKGAAAYVNSGSYGTMKKVTFEASIGVPSGNQTAYVRLYNATDKHPVWYSEMSMVGAGPELLLSPSITLDSGNKLYQVQMKSQLGATTNLLQARIHILLY